MMRPILTLSILMSLLLAIHPLQAETLEVAGPDDTRSYTQSSLLAIGASELRTETPWTDGHQEFSGVPLQAVLAESGIHDGRVAAEALNGYSVDIPVRQAVNAGAFIAVHLDGQPMRVKDKGPYWIVFPWSSDGSLDNREIRAWSIWQLVRLRSLD